VGTNRYTFVSANLRKLLKQDILELEFRLSIAAISFLLDIIIFEPRSADQERGWSDAFELQAATHGESLQALGKWEQRAERSSSMKLRRKKHQEMEEAW
jgi:hypothetical protein